MSFWGKRGGGNLVENVEKWGRVWYDVTMRVVK